MGQDWGHDTLDLAMRGNCIATIRFMVKHRRALSHPIQDDSRLAEKFCLAVVTSVSKSLEMWRAILPACKDLQSIQLINYAHHIDGALEVTDRKFRRLNFVQLSSPVPGCHHNPLEWSIMFLKVQNVRYLVSRGVRTTEAIHIREYHHLIRCGKILEIGQLLKQHSMPKLIWRDSPTDPPDEGSDHCRCGHVTQLGFGEEQLPSEIWVQKESEATRLFNRLNRMGKR